MERNSPGSDSGRPLRVVLAVNTLTIGGSETQVVRMVTGLRAHGHDAHVMAMVGGGPLEAQLLAAGVQFRIFGYLGIRRPGPDGGRHLSLRSIASSVRGLYRMWRYLRVLRPDVCHAFMYGSSSHILPLAWAAGVLVRISGRRGAPPPAPTRLSNRVSDALGRRASSAYLCNSRAGAAAAIDAEGIDPSRVHVIPNCVELTDRAADVSRQPARGIVVANLRACKGHADLVEALALLSDPPRVSLVGEGPERVRLAALIAERNLGGVVELLGSVDAAEKLLPGYQFAVLASHSEGMPNAVLESMAAGLPVVATAVGGVPELVIDGVTGLLVPPHRPLELAAAIGRVAGDPQLRLRLGQAAREAAREFSMSNCIRKHETVYRKQRV